ncbi:hypothetical protein DW006_09640 [Eubacterium sp. AF36-5BH]|uniref:aminoacyl--tRNA ligase-related protein n=1 Tax=Eubacterium sp. AF36-5BH TaxID=2293108 RepID=UPI000E52F93F|nr:aminoacyl--tRNA ligase-related protein [Eubacterium sp. AF36-5BH]RGF49409.1 hypothetical protein DW006_09640 [Eubacterium sp. AF36-5BH]
MKKIEIELDDKVILSEFKKIVGFVSENIEGVRFENCKLILNVSDDTNESELTNDIISLANKYIPNSSLEQKEFENRIDVIKYENDFSSVHYFDDGMISFSDQSLFLFNYFNSVFEKIAEDAFSNEKTDFVKKIYPVMLPVSSYKKTGYLKRSPQYSIFCCSAVENLKSLGKIDSINFYDYKSVINNPQYALSPSACFHVYEEYKNRILEKDTVVTFVQNVFRNEGRFNFSQFGRMRDYHVREIVFIGDNDFINNSMEKMIGKIKEFIKYVNVDSKIIVATDSFILPKMQKFKKIQQLDKSKYELQVSYDVDKYMSVASFNLHGTAFTYPFNIKIKDKDTVTGCIGFGLERFVLSFLSQYGEDSNNWPELIRKEYKN